MNRKLEVGISAVLVVFTLGFIFVNTSNNYQSYTASYTAPTPLSALLSSDKVRSPAHATESFPERLQRILDEVGGDSSVGIHPVPNACGVNAYACVLAFDSNTIQIDELNAFATDEDLRGAIAHELGHVVNNRMPLDSYIKYMVPFGFDREYFADCMAIARVGYTISDYGFTCTPEQVSLAAEAWTWYDAEFN